MRTKKKKVKALKKRPFLSLPLSTTWASGGIYILSKDGREKNERQTLAALISVIQRRGAFKEHNLDALEE